MTKLLRTILATLAITTAATLVVPAAAQISPIKADECESKLGIAARFCRERPSGEYVSGLVLDILNAFLALLAIAAVIALIYAGVKYIISLGNEDEVKKAKMIIVYAVIGLLVVGLAAAIVNFVLTTFTPGGAGGGAGGA